MAINKQRSLLTSSSTHDSRRGSIKITIMIKIKEAGLFALGNSRVNVTLRPKFTWSIKGMCGVLCAGFGSASLYCGYNKNYRGAIFAGIGSVISGYSYYKLDERDITAQEKVFANGHTSFKHSTPDKQPESQSAEPEISIFDSRIDCKGHSSSELFKHTRDDNTKWIAEGYMKVGMVNLVVAGGGVGKTIFMVQVALAVDKGCRPEFLPIGSCASARLQVVYYRLENFKDELEGKYGNGKTLKESGIKWFLPEDLPENNLNGFVDHIKALATSLTEDTLVCIDPATKLDGYKHAEFIKGADEAMAIAKDRNVTLTILGTVHLDEIKDWSVLTNCDIKGGDKGLQQAGSVTALRRERTDVEEYRFLQCLKEPKGSPKPFNGEVLVMKKVHEKLDENNKYLHYKFDCIKSEVQARPEKPKAQANANCDNKCYAPSTAPNQKVTPIIEKKMEQLFANNEKPSMIAKKLGLSEKTIRRYKQKYEAKAV